MLVAQIIMKINVRVCACTKKRNCTYRNKRNLHLPLFHTEGSVLMALGCARMCGQTRTDTHLCTAVHMGVGLCYGNCAAGQVKGNPTNVK